MPYNDSNPLLDAALDYAQRGWWVFPLTPGGKAPLGTLAPHGLKDASTAAETIRGWWAQEPNANIAIATGQSKLVVVDIDTKGEFDGWDSWHDLLAKLGRELDETPTVNTPTGGGHVYFAYTGNRLRNSAGKLGPGLDIRAAGGYVVAPPSLHPNGKHYTWEVGYAPDEMPLLTLPGALEELLAAKRVDPGPSTAQGAVIQAGSRNVTLTSLAGSMRRRGASPEAIVAALLVENATCNPPLEREEVLTIAASVARYEPNQEERATDLGNARRLITLHGQDMHFCDPLGGWYTWCGMRWQPDNTGIVERYAKDVSAALYAEAAVVQDADLRKDLAKRALRAESARAKRDMLDLAWSEPGIPLPPDAFDRDPWLFNCLNGTIDLRTGELHAHDRNDLITRMAPVHYDPEATLPLWDRFLDTATNGDRELQGFLMACAGYSLTGSTAEEKLLFVYGPAATGKSTFIEAVKRVFGDYAATAAFDSFLIQDHNGGPRDDIARLTGARLVSSVEVDKGKRLADSLVKQITGGDMVTARFLYHRAFEYTPQFKLWLVANDAPRVADSDSGLWRRILRVPFAHQIPEAERDPNVKAQLTNLELAGPAILAWCVKGCLEWQRSGLLVPTSVRESTEAYRAENDPLREFYTECCFFDPQAQATREAVWNAYQRWANENGERWKVTNRELADRLRRRGCRDGKRVGERYWKGIGLVAEGAEHELL
ncbi:MAG: phage/plasmid primase, P4 family [Anaerolineae bacterium]